MQKFDSILFDFDGTLFDSSPGVFASFEKVAEHYGLNIDKNTYNLMIGPPLKYSFNKILGLPESEVQNAIKVYRNFYSQGGMYNCNVYDGIADLLEKLRAAGKMVCVATSKPEIYARAILEKKGMADLFDFIGGADGDENNRIEKADVVRYVLKTQGLEDKKDSVLMIGDRCFDVNGAHECGLKCMGILWGFGNREEFKECGADFVCETPEAVADFLLK